MNKKWGFIYLFFIFIFLCTNKKPVLIIAPFQKVVFKITSKHGLESADNMESLKINFAKKYNNVSAQTTNKQLYLLLFIY